MYYVAKIAELLDVNNSIAADVYTRLCIGGADFSEMSRDQFEREVWQQYWSINKSSLAMLMAI